MNIRTMVDAVEGLADEYKVGQLQQLRVNLLGLSRPRTRRIFGQGVSEKGGWAYHSGGREELQFNLGLETIDGVDWARAGLAFSFEPSRSFPDIGLLRPLALRFNAFMELNHDAFPGTAMWHWRDQRRSADYRPGPIGPELMQPKCFVFLGVKRLASSFDARWALEAFDELLPIYRYVMSSRSSAPVLQAPRPFVFAPRRTTGGAHQTTAFRQVGAVSVDLRHRQLQAALCDELTEVLGPQNVSEEAAIAGYRADVVTRELDGLVLYEIKTSGTARACLREALGQLLEYGFWPKALRPARLVVCGEPDLDDDARAYVTTLNTAFPAQLAYRRIVLAPPGH